MKATDLMLNDLVMCNNKVCKVCSIEGVMVLVSFKDGEKLTIEDNIEPIPLTPEILEKNGFTKENRLYYWTQEKDGKTIAGVYYWVDEKYINIAGYEDDGVTISCPYVHTLQHALKLCGIDKEIIL